MCAGICTYVHVCVSAVFGKCFKGGGGKTVVPRNKEGGGGGGGGKGEPGIQLFSAIYAILPDIRLDEFPRGGGEKKARGGKCPSSPCSPLNAPLCVTQWEWVGVDVTLCMGVSG